MFHEAFEGLGRPSMRKRGDMTPHQIAEREKELARMGEWFNQTEDYSIVVLGDMIEVTEFAVEADGYKPKIDGASWLPTGLCDLKLEMMEELPDGSRLMGFLSLKHPNIHIPLAVSMVFDSIEDATIAGCIVRPIILNNYGHITGLGDIVAEQPI
ncbi:hypothetical protein [Thiospirillum jenense]|uniref:Uncharacterized protein n=1 Tax=Thiospirillum jenense TaxID=1653858 RepID=A0A839HBK2_9GAMM|nr:hypothetical protein [Thiospirillum jenense]MBB1125570.1 hypothetical protein [Thiospirillum jenense]